MYLPPFGHNYVVSSRTTSSLSPPGTLSQKTDLLPGLGHNLHDSCPQSHAAGPVSTNTAGGRRINSHVCTSQSTHACYISYLVTACEATE